MIQRIQTVYLFLVFLLMLLMYFFPLTTFTDGREEYELVLQGIRRTNTPDTYVVPALYMFILWMAAIALPLVNIFLYKFRWLQMRLCLVEIVLALGLQIFAGIYIFNAKSVAEQYVSHAVKYSVTDLIPLVCIILSVLAFRSIVRDQRLIQSLNRIR